MDSVELISNSFNAWRPNKAAMKYFAILLSLQLLVSAVSIMAYSYFLGQDFFSIPYIEDAPAQQLQDKYAGVNLMLFPLAAAASIAAVYIYLLIIRAALRQFGFKTGKFDSRKKLHSYVLIIASTLAGAFSLYDKKFLLLPLAAAALSFLQGTAQQFSEALANFVSLAILTLLLAYVCVTIRNFARLLMAFPIFFTEEKNVLESLSASWEETSGKAMRVIVPAAGLFAIFAVANVTLVYAFSELGKLAGIYTGFIALAVILPTLVNVFMGAMYGVANNYLAVLIHKELK